MTKVFDDGGQKLDLPRSRRTFFKWMGQVAAGASLASVGFNAMNPLNAQAANKAVRLPDCIQCPCNGCYDFGCAASPSCGPQGRHAKFTYEGGCVPPGTPCPYTITYTDGCC